jgi:CheY-like chemotaxis protein
MLAVSDTGCGMTAETRAHLFEPFFTTKEHGKGTGLGLSTVYGIIKQSGGSIWVSSDPGQGTTFKVYLPQVDALVRSTGPKDASAEALRGSETVLLVEDNPGVRTLVRKMLARYGYRIIDTSDPDEALAWSSRHPGPIDLLVTDVVMPGMSGPVLAERLAQRHPGLRILFMSGYTDDTVLHHGVLSPGIHFLQKPFTHKGLAGRVREVLDAPAS